MDKRRNTYRESHTFSGSNDISRYRDMGRYSSSKKNSKNLDLGGVSSSSKTSIEDGFKPTKTPVSSSNPLVQENADPSKYSRKSRNQYSHKKLQSRRRSARKKRILGTVLACFIFAIIGVAVYICFPATVSVNGKDITLTYNKTVGEAIKVSEQKVNPGNYVAVDYSVLKKGSGHEYCVEINGEEVFDMDKTISAGTEVSYKNGKDIMEDYTSNDSDIKAKSAIKGSGSIHKFEGDGKPGTWSVLTGKVSKKVAERQTKEPGDVTVTNYNADTNNEKVLALTFDDGPSEEYTEEILDLLKKYNAKATFFVIGENVDTYPKLVAKEYNAGHQVCTHTYDHARGYGATDITNMPVEKRIQEVLKGQQSIAKATGKPCSTVCRLPGGNLDKDTAKYLAQYVTAEIGWNVDTGDWERPGSSKILSTLKLATPGDIILCHDGGGDRSQTVAALKEFLPYATEKGYKFVTIDELLEYPAAEQSSSNQRQASGNTKPSTYTNG